MDNNKILSDREMLIFLALVTDYINNSEPVGSRTLSKKIDIELSPASIRNIMADLEEKGFLTHPHTSAGRIPTEKGYRFLVNHIMECLIREKTKPLISHKNLESLLIQIRERAAMLSKISSILSNLSRYLGVVMAPKVSQLTLKHIDFVHMGGHQCLAIFVSQSGLVFNRMIKTEEIIQQEQLDKMARYVNHQFEGLSLSEIKEKIFQIMSDEKILYDRFICQSIQMSKDVIDQEGICDVYIDGRLNILDQPEFSDPKKMRSFFDTVEEKERLIKIMDQYQDETGVKVVIGSENLDPHMKDCSLVMCPYQIRSQVHGIVGVIGPTRMRYREVIYTVNQMAAMMTKIFQQMQ
ncbi:MAG: heat-inducible transcriptional repressor HrcA [bacterium]